MDGMELTPEMVAYLKQQLAQRSGNSGHSARGNGNGDGTGKGSSRPSANTPAQVTAGRSEATDESSDGQPQKGITLSLEDDDFDEF